MTGDDFALSQQRVLAAMPWLCGIGVLVVLGGIVLAWSSGVSYWVDRSGKALVVVSLALTYLQFRLEYRYADRLTRRVDEGKKRAQEKGYLPDEAGRIAGRARDGRLAGFEQTRRRVFMRALTLAGAGELIAAFGGTLFSAILV